MTLATAVEIVKNNFPSYLSKLMVDQIDLLCFEEAGENQALLIRYFANWNETNEGPDFWKEINKIYAHQYEVTEETFIEIFKKYNIPFIK